MSKTPGPWTADLVNGYIATGNEVLLHLGDQVSDADAHLIAAAPLYDEVARLTVAEYELTGAVSEATINLITQAIMRAEGDS